tara:strand:- start:10816 stop:11121 length:306 start_codon:yes stop_codon:yes gene_type:complete
MNTQSQFEFAISHSRNTDPNTSFEAAKKILTSGAHHSQSQKTLALVKRYPGLTSAELAFKTDELTRAQIARRLPDLEKQNLIKKGDVRMCAVCKLNSVIWF